MVDELMDGRIAAEDPMAAADFKAISFVVRGRARQTIGAAGFNVVRRAYSAGTVGSLEDWKT